MKILVTENVEQEGVELLKKHFDVVDQKTGLTPDELKAILYSYDALLIRSATKVTAAVLEAGKNLKAIARAGVGVDNVDVFAATRQGVLVLNAPHGNTISAAEMAVALMLAACRHVVSSNTSLRKGKWERSEFIGIELCGKTVGVLGLGPVGSHVTKILKGFDCRVMAYDPFVPEEKVNALGVERVKELNVLLQESDVITVHVPLTPTTRDLISHDAFSKMKRGVIVINAARGGIVNEEALYNALLSGQVAAAGLDVYAMEPPASDSFASKLIALPNVVATPHLGASTHDAQKKVAVWAAEELVLALQGKPVRSAVNPSVLDQIKTVCP